jgi:hypothetical protein
VANSPQWERRRALFNRLAEELYFGFNMRCVMQELNDETIERLERLVERAYSSRTSNLRREPEAGSPAASYPSWAEAAKR